MNTRVVVGAQWGDEGKGKVTDYLAQRSDLVVRFQGGNNAGHTIEAKGKTYKLQLIPSGIVYGESMNVIGNGVVFHPGAFLKEKETLEALGVEVSPRTLAISDRVHLIMPYHLVLDRLKEAARGKGDIGTTGKGIGPCYTDKYERCGIRLCDLLDPQVFLEKLERNLAEKNAYITKILGGEALALQDIAQEYLSYAEAVRPFVRETSVLLEEAIQGGKNVLFEGAQGMLLDIDYGTYPYVTSSNTTAGGVAAGAGVGPNQIEEVYGVTKAYTTRVGKGPFPTELTDELGEHLREKGHEYGTVTGRSRRCGWLDLVIVKTAARISGLTHLVVTKLDTLAGLDRIMVCTAYELDGRRIDYVPASLKDLARCKPIYQEMKGWDDSIAHARVPSDLAPEVRDYLDLIERTTKVSVHITSVGPDREETIEMTQK
ncbi:Adenylosuccinate synthetase [Clostridiaceae bacterium JG1575]|nr:Adenylosuccinate synthetase [Clostridiaceae bacterium JG1575]